MVRNVQSRWACQRSPTTGVNAGPVRGRDVTSERRVSQPKGAGENRATNLQPLAK